MNICGCCTAYMLQLHKYCGHTLHFKHRGVLFTSNSALHNFYIGANVNIDLAFDNLSALRKPVMKRTARLQVQGYWAISWGFIWRYQQLVVVYLGGGGPKNQKKVKNTKSKLKK